MGKYSIGDFILICTADEPNLDDILNESSSDNDENEEQPVVEKVEENKTEKETGKDSSRAH